MRLFFTALTALLLLQGCLGLKIGGGSENRKKRRAARKIAKAQSLAPDLFGKDTIVIFDTVVVERTTSDTVTTIIYNDSTIIVNNDRVYARYYYDTLRQEIHHEIECKEITRPIETRVVTQSFRELTFWEQFGHLIPWIVFLCVVMLIIKFVFGR